jgi:ribonuclease Z
MPRAIQASWAVTTCAHHSMTGWPAREAGMVFQRARPKLAAYTHLVFLANEWVSPAFAADLIMETRQSYSGPLVVGEDLMSFEIGETVHVRRRRHPGTGAVKESAEM